MWMVLGPPWMAFAQTESDAAPFRPQRFWVGMGSVVVADAAVMGGLDRLSYSDHDRTRFHWYNDWDPYVQQDKLGHYLVSSHPARGFGESRRQRGLGRPTA